MSPEKSESGSRPNILWICTDQQRYDTLGCTGNPFVHTPNLDKLAREGLLFEQAYCQSPVCTPSRASFLTGRYPRTTRCRQNGQSIPADEVLVTKMLADDGYTGGLSGKLHIAAANPQVAPTHERRIDDGYADFNWSHTPLPSKIKSTTNFNDGYGDFNWSHDTGNLWPTNAYMLWLRERGERYRREPFRGSEHVQVSVPAELHQTTWCAQKAITFMEAGVTFDRPWFYSVNPFDPHHPFDPPEEYLLPYLDRLDEIPLPAYRDGELADKPPFQAIDHAQAYNTPGQYPFGEMTDYDHRLVRAAYWAMVDLIDDQVGAMIEALERSGQRENTLVIFMSDHGEMLGDHGIYLKGPYCYEPAVRVPLILSWPGRIEPDRRSRALVELVDLAPTLLEATGREPHAGMQGRSLWPLIEGRTPLDEHREDLLCEYYNAMPWHTDPQAHVTMVRTRDHKLVVAHGTGMGELYDLTADPGESKNLWDDPGYAGVKSALLLRLADRMAWTVDPLPPREANW